MSVWGGALRQNGLCRANPVLVKAYQDVPECFDGYGLLRAKTDYVVSRTVELTIYKTLENAVQAN